MPWNMQGSCAVAASDALHNQTVMTLDPADQKSPSPKRIDTTPTTLLHHYRNLYISYEPRETEVAYSQY
jgi:hypothetical protein